MIIKLAMYNEKWNEICFLLSENIKSDISENEFEQNVIRALEALNWREFSGDINIRPSIQVGASGSIVPDFVIKKRKDKNLFVIEIKQPTIPLNTNFQQQLFSYMRLLKLDYGLLIGQVIQLFYDGDLSNRETPVILDTFEFKRDNPKGHKFVELFLKDNFSFESLEAFTINSLKRINRKAEEKNLHKKVLSTDYQKEVVELIKQDLLKEYDSEIIDNVLQDISLTIASENNLKVETPNYQHNVLRETRRPVNPTEKRIVDGMKIGQYVQYQMRKVYKENLLTEEELKNLQDKMYSKDVFDQNFEVLKGAGKDITGSDGRNRYYIKEKFFGEYFLTSQWVERHWEPFLNWMDKINKNHSRTDL